MTLPIRLEFSWPDGRPRDLQRVEFTINDAAGRKKAGVPFDQYNYRIAELPAGK